MRSRISAIRLLALVLLVGVSAAACGRYSIGNIRSLMAFKEANGYYQKQDFAKAIPAYEEAIEHNPEFGLVYFFLGHSHDNMYKSSAAGNAENDQHIQKAVEYYNKAIQTIKPEEPSADQIRKLAYEYLIAAYGPDKLNDFSQAEPIAKRLIDMEPNEPGNYQTLGKLYEDQGRYEDAEAYFIKATEVRPNDPVGYAALAGYYNRQANFEKTMEAWESRAKVEPNNPEAHHTIATWLWEKAFKDFRLDAKTKRAYIDRAIAAEDTALSLHADYIEALTYKNILLRMKANTEKDRKVIDGLIKEADRLRDRAMELQKQQAEAAAAGSGSGSGSGGL